MNNSKPLNKTFLIILLGVLAAIGPFTIDMYLPAFKEIALDFNTNESRVAFTLTSYFVGIAIGQLIYGPLVDKYGRKKPLLIGLLIYTVAALGCALSQSIESLIVTRMLQALGGCVGMVASNAIISDVYEPNKRAKAFSSIMLVMGVAPLIAPSVGSLFLEIGEWNFIFYFLAFFSLFVAALIYFFLPETSLYMHSNKLEISTISKGYLEILKNPTFLFYTLAGSIAMAILFAYISSASFVFQTLYELDKRTFSLLFAVNASGLVIGNYLNGVVVGKVNYIKVAKVASVLICAVAFFAFFLFFTMPELPYQVVVACLFIMLMLTSFINPNATAASLSPFKANTGAASALAGSLRMGIGAMVAAVIGMVQGNSVLTLFGTILIMTILVTLLLVIVPKMDKKRVNKKVATV